MGCGFGLVIAILHLIRNNSIYEQNPPHIRIDALNHLKPRYDKKLNENLYFSRNKTTTKS